MKKENTNSPSLKNRYSGLLRSFRKDCEGVAAVEFALIAPLMIALFIGTLEVSAAVSVNRKVSRISSVVGDLVTQNDELTGNAINAIMDVAGDIMAPYSNIVKIRITGITVEDGDATVVWSCNSHWSSAGVGEDYNVPDSIRTDGTFLVAARVQTDYQPMVGWTRYSGSGTGAISFDQTEITMDEQIFLRPRVGSAVDVTC